MLNIKSNTLIPPDHYKICKSEDDYFELISWCWKKLEQVKSEVSAINFYKDDASLELGYYMKATRHLHNRITQCYEHLQSLGNSQDITRATDVFTSTLAHKHR